MGDILPIQATMYEIAILKHPMIVEYFELKVLEVIYENVMCHYSIETFAIENNSDIKFEVCFRQILSVTAISSHFPL